MIHFALPVSTCWMTSAAPGVVGVVLVRAVVVAEEEVEVEELFS